MAPAITRRGTVTGGRPPGETRSPQRAGRTAILAEAYGRETPQIGGAVLCYNAESRIMSSRPFEEFPITPEEPYSDETPSSRGDEPPRGDSIRGEGWEARPDVPTPPGEERIPSGEYSLPFQRPWDGNQHAIIVSGGEGPAAHGSGPRAEMVPGLGVVGAPPAAERKPLSRRVGRVTRELVETLILALLIFLAVRAAVQNFQVEGSSMDPGLQNGQFLLVNKLLYARVDLDGIDRFIPFIDLPDGEHHIFGSPQRGDVVVFRFPGDESRDFIKRIIGVPGDKVEVRIGKVFINNLPIDEPYLTHTANYNIEPLTVPPASYFVLGDNRPGSFDSHSWISRQPTPDWPNPPFIPEGNIIGKAWLLYWPFDDWGLAPNKSLTPSMP